jgi:formamidopyrimidine-DNA glycosylase
MQGLAERLDQLLRGATLERASPLQFSASKTFDPPLESLIGREVTAVGRRGKYLIIDFDGPRMLVHLSQGGRVLLEDPPKNSRPKGAVLRLGFGSRPSVLIREFGTQRKAGWWVLAEGDEGPLDVLGPEPFTKEFDDFVMTSTDSRRIHTVLRDQRTLAGIGRGNADDILHEAQLSPYATFGKLGESDMRRLLDATGTVLERALVVERSREGGLPTKLGERFVVHGKAGKSCPRCGETLRRVSYEDYEIAYCPSCQTGGKVLADRRLSRLIR